MKLLVAIPCADEIPKPFVESLMSLRFKGDTKVKFIAHSLIYDARNQFANYAIQNNFDYVLWLDSDMVFTNNEFEELMNELGDKDYLTGLYFNRRPNYKTVIFKKLGWEKGEQEFEIKPIAEHYEDYPKKDVFEIEGSGFGFVLTSVKCLKKIKDEYGLPFSPILGFGEDLSFCLRLKEQGIKMYCDSKANIGHLSKFVVDERMSEAMKRGAKNEEAN